MKNSNDSNEIGKDQPDPSPNKTFLKEFWLAMGAYVVVLIVSERLVDHIEADLLRGLVALAPMIPVGFVVRSVLNFVRNLDELQQRIHGEAAIFSLIVTGMLSFALGLLEVADLPSLNLLWVMPLGFMFWGVGLSIARRRYE